MAAGGPPNEAELSGIQDPEADPGLFTETPPVEQAPEPAPEPDPVQAALEAERQARLEAEQRESQQRRQYQQTLESLVQTQQQPAPAVAPETPAPDPATDPDGFNRWLLQQRQADQARTQQAIASVRNELSEAEMRSRLWSDFQRANPEYADKEDMVRMAFRLEYEDGSVSNNDPQEVMRRVKTRLDRIKSELAPPAPAAARTAGVSAASRARPDPKPPAKETPPKAKTLSDSLRKMQKESGFF